MFWSEVIVIKPMNNPSLHAFLMSPRNHSELTFVFANAVKQTDFPLDTVMNCFANARKDVNLKNGEIKVSRSNVFDEGSEVFTVLKTID